MELCPENKLLLLFKAEEQYFSTQLYAELSFSLTYDAHILTPAVNPQQ